MILPGHRITRLIMMDFGTFDVGPGNRRIGIPGFLLQTDGGANILVDTGFDPAYATDYAATDSRDQLSGFGRLIDFTARQTAAGQMALLGLAVSDISHLVLTHGHIDHAGSLPLFRCPILLTRAERAAPRPIYWSSSQPIAWPDVPYIEIAQETAVCHGLHLIPTPGHTPGHLSLLVSIGDHHLILAADAINRESEPAEGFSDAMDPVTAAVSAARLFDLQSRLGATLIYGHEPSQWLNLPKAPLDLAAL